MAAVARPPSTASTRAASPTPSDSSQYTRPSEPAVSYNRSPRPGRSPARPLLRTSFRHFTGLATIVVGESGHKARPRTEYLVHKELLTAASPFFAAALAGAFAEGLDQRVHLPEEKPEIFEWFLQWLYTGTLTTPSSGDGAGAHVSRSRYHSEASQSHRHHLEAAFPNPPTSSSSSASHLADLALDGDLRNAAGSPKYFLLLDLYALSDRLLTTPLSNHVLTTMARLSEVTNSVPTPSDTWLLYESGMGDDSNNHKTGRAGGSGSGGNTASSLRDASPVRALVLDLFAYKKTDRLLETHRDDWHPQFLRDLVVKLKRPGPDAIERHSLIAWRPRSWSQARACAVCGDLLRPGGGGGGGAGAGSGNHTVGGNGGSRGDRCVVCDRAFCNECLRRHAADPNFAAPHDPAGCKPWSGRGMCLRYHEHPDGVSCM